MLETLPELPTDSAAAAPLDARSQRLLTPPSSGTASPTLRPRIVDYDGLCAPGIPPLNSLHAIPLTNPAHSTRTRLTESPSSLAEREQQIRDATNTILTCIGEDPLRPGLLGTPDRFARAILASTQGYSQSVHSIVNDAIFPEDSNDMVIISDIRLSSLCEHHLLPFEGSLHVGYIPSGRVLGLSKFARVAEMFAARLQIQERLTRQIADALQEILQPQGLAVVLDMRHACMTCRGVEQGSSRTTTSSMQGMMRSRDRTRREFLALLRQR